jgi:hypothetical protein
MTYLPETWPILCAALPDKFHGRRSDRQVARLFVVGSQYVKADEVEVNAS